jgi:hypothetical protein
MLSQFQAEEEGGRHSLSVEDLHTKSTFTGFTVFIFTFALALFARSQSCFHRVPCLW